MILVSNLYDFSNLEFPWYDYFEGSFQVVKVTLTTQGVTPFLLNPSCSRKAGVVASWMATGLLYVPKENPQLSYQGFSHDFLPFHHALMIMGRQLSFCNQAIQDVFAFDRSQSTPDQIVL